MMIPRESIIRISKKYRISYELYLVVRSLRRFAGCGIKMPKLDRA